MTGKPFVPKVNWQTGQFADFFRKALNFKGLMTNLSRKIDGVTHHNPRHSEPPAKPGNRAEILAFVSPPFQSQYGLRCQPQLVRDRDPYPLRPDVKREISGCLQTVQLELLTHALTYDFSLSPVTPSCRLAPGTIEQRQRIDGAMNRVLSGEGCSAAHGSKPQSNKKKKKRLGCSGNFPDPFARSTCRNRFSGLADLRSVWPVHRDLCRVGSGLHLHPHRSTT